MENLPMPSNPSLTPSETRPFKVLGIGTACMDYLLSVPAFPEENDKVYAEDMEIQGGGNCGNTLAGLSRLGIGTSLVTRIGSDATGREIRRSLEKEGVGTDDILETGDRSPVSFVVVNRSGRTRTVIHRKGIGYDVPFPFDPKWLRHVDLVYLGGRFDMERQVAAEAKKRGIMVVVEAEHTGTGAHRLFGHADAVITSEDFHRAYFGSDDVENNLARIAARGPDTVVATRGERGAMLWNKGEFFCTKAVEVTVVDTTGAGDALAAGVIYGLLHSFAPQRLLEFSRQVAAHKCRFSGARKGLPYRKNMERYL
jgi:sulfofructose kinase